MIDIEETATRAVESPVARPPEMAHIEELAGRQRRRRAARRGATGAAVVVLAVAIGIAVAATSRDDRVKVATTSPSTAASTPSSPTTIVATPGTFAELLSRLKLDYDVVDDGTANGSPVAGDAHLLCVDHTRLHVYEYPDVAQRAAVSDMISSDGYELRTPTDANGHSGSTIIEWVDTPHFFAQGRIIVLMFGSNEPLMTWLTNAVGPTLTTETHARGSRETCPDR